MPGLLKMWGKDRDESGQVKRWVGLDNEDQFRGNTKLRGRTRFKRGGVHLREYRGATRESIKKNGPRGGGGVWNRKPDKAAESSPRDEKGGPQ